MTSSGENCLNIRKWVISLPIRSDLKLHKNWGLSSETDARFKGANITWFIIHTYTEIDNDGGDQHPYTLYKVTQHVYKGRPYVDILLFLGVAVLRRPGLAVTVLPIPVCVDGSVLDEIVFVIY